MTTFLIDTNIVSELVRANPNPKVISFLSDVSDLWVSVILFHELTYGIDKTADADRKVTLLTFCEALCERFNQRTLPVDLQTAETAARLRAFAHLQGRVLTSSDALIAATAMNAGHTLVTRNVKDFDRLSIPLLDPFE
jgi:toxin FitB